MILRLKTTLFILATATLLLAGCDNGAQSQKGSQDKNAAGNSDDDDDDDDAVAGGGSSLSGGDLDGWCTKAGEVDTVTKKMGDLYEALCSGNSPTAMMKSTLIKKAYSGSGTPKVVDIEAIQGDKTYSTWFFGVGIKLPIDIETHFNKVGPKGGDEKSQKKLAESQGIKDPKFEVQEEYKKDGKYHVRGWKTYSYQEKMISIIKVVTESIARSDQYELDEGTNYMYTQYIVEGKQGVKDFSLLTAGVKTDSGSYLITVGKLKVNNKGQPELAKGQIQNTAKDLIKSMYKSAADAQ